MSIEAMDRNGCNSVYAKGKPYLSAIIIIPSTNVETVALLTHKKEVERVNIEMTVEKEAVTKKATYQKD